MVTAQDAIYEAYWSSGAFSLGEGVRSVTRYLVGTDEFDEEGGYGRDDREAIAALPVGGTWAGGDYGQWHRVRRVAASGGPTALNADPVAEDNGDFAGGIPLYEESRGIRPIFDDLPDPGHGWTEHRIVSPAYFRAGTAYRQESMIVADHLNPGETWTSDEITLRRIR